MKSTLALQTLRSRWFVTSYHAGLWLLLYLIASHLGGKAPQFTDGESALPGLQKLPPVAHLDRIFSDELWHKPLVTTNSVDAFFTRYFIPPSAPPSPPPTTRKIELVYQGYYQTEDGRKQTVVKQAEEFLVASVGGKLTANLYAADATMSRLILTNSTAETNILFLNAK